MKLVGNLVVAAQLEALGESLSLAKKAGLNLHDVLGEYWLPREPGAVRLKASPRNHESCRSEP